jgi:hypothetical protein
MPSGRSLIKVSNDPGRRVGFTNPATPRHIE